MTRRNGRPVIAAAGAASRFEATYVTTGSSPATVIYAVRPPKGLAFRETPGATVATPDRRPA